MKRFIVFFTFFLSILTISTVFLPYSVAVKRFILFVYGLWVIALGDMLRNPKFYVYGGFFLILSVFEAPFLISALFTHIYIMPKIPLLQTGMPPAGATFLQPAVLLSLIHI